MLILLDTNILSLLQRQVQPATGQILARLQMAPKHERWTTVITFQEQTRGWLAAIHRARNDDQLLWAYRSLSEMLDKFRNLNVFSFDETAMAIFNNLESQRLGVGTHDLRIASIALARGAKVITQNVRDFERVPGLLVEDWTV